MHRESSLYDDDDDDDVGGPTDAEYGITPKRNSQEQGASGASNSSPSSLMSQRWGYLLCLSLAVAFMAFEITVNSTIELESTVGGIMRISKPTTSSSYQPYQPLVGHDYNKNSSAFYEGREYSEFDDDFVPITEFVKQGIEEEGDGSSRIPPPVRYGNTPTDTVTVPAAHTEKINNGARGSGSGNSTLSSSKSTALSESSSMSTPLSKPLPPKSKDRIHPRMACFMGINSDINNEKPYTCENTLHDVEFEQSSMPQMSDRGGKKSKKDNGSSEDYSNVRSSETEECELSDPSYQTVPAAPSTCNDMHALGFRFGPSKHEPMQGVKTVYPSRHSVKYLTSGGFRSVWTVTRLAEEEKEGNNNNKVIMKTNQLRRGWSMYYLDQNRRDILISERAGKAAAAHSNANVLPVYQYCAFSSVVPFATTGPLDDYVSGRIKKGQLMGVSEIYKLALQAARGLHQAQLFRGGKATHVHADVKPPQFLLFTHPEKNATNDITPIMQLNDFNRGKFLTKSKLTNETCPFTMCNVHHKGSLYRSPEEYMDCADQDDKIDVYSLGGVFFYLMADGRKPWYHIGKYDKGVKAILNGEHPPLPSMEEYSHKYKDEKMVAFVTERMKHPAMLALKRVMTKCWEFEPKDRPSAYDVVKMLEDKLERLDGNENAG